MLIARYGVYVALALAVGSVLLAMNAGTAFEPAMLRAVFVFVLFTAIAFGAEAVFATSPLRTVASPVPHHFEAAPAAVEDEVE